MTLYTRGYRPYDGGFTARGPRFLPIVREGWRQATRTRAFVILGLVVVFFVVLLGFFLYYQAGPLKAAFQAPRRHGGFRGLPADLGDPAFFLEAALVSLHEWDWTFVVLLAVLVGCGLVADDLRARALPLYLARPITPLDYYLGKLLVPVSVLAATVLLPGLFLVLLAGLMLPSGETIPFLRDQGGVVVALLLHFVVLALAYSSVMLLFSTWSTRRIGAIVLGAVTLLGGEVLRNAVVELDGTVADVLRACSLYGDTRAILFRALDREAGESAVAAYASTEASLAVVGLVVLLAAWVVLRRARTVEVVA